MLERVVSGFQTGADMGSIQAALLAGLATGGWAPKGWITETCPRPDYAARFGAEECQEGTTPASRYRRRAKANVRDSDGTLAFDATCSIATDNAYHDAKALGKPFRCVMLDRTPAGLVACVAAHTHRNIADWIIEEKIRTLNVCGNRESKVPGIEGFVAAYLAEVFRLLARSKVPAE